MNLIKVLWCRFQQCPSTFTILLLEGPSATGLFRHLSNHVFGVFNCENRKAVRLNFLFKIFKIWSSFKKAVKNSEICFCLWDNYIWIDFVKLFLLREGYISSAANILTSSPKIQFPCQWQMVMIKVMWSRFQLCFCKFTILFVEGSSETRLFRHLCDNVFGVRNLENKKCIRIIFFLKMFKI